MGPFLNLNFDAKFLVCTDTTGAHSTTIHGKIFLFFCWILIIYLFPWKQINYFRMKTGWKFICETHFSSLFSQLPCWTSWPSSILRRSLFRSRVLQARPAAAQFTAPSFRQLLARRVPNRKYVRLDVASQMKTGEAKIAWSVERATRCISSRGFDDQGDPGSVLYKVKEASRDRVF